MEWLAAALIGVVSAIITGGISYATTQRANAQDQANFDKQFDYNSQLQTHLEEREDTKWQSEAADAAAVGINPLSLSGASSNVPVVSQPTAPVSRVAQMPDLVSSITSALSSVSSVQVNGAQKDLLMSEKRFNDARTRFQNLENQTYIVRLLDQLKSSQSDRDFKSSQSLYNASLKEYQDHLLMSLKNYEDTGLNINMTPQERAYTIYNRDRQARGNFGMITDAEFNLGAGRILGSTYDNPWSELVHGLFPNVLRDTDGANDPVDVFEDDKSSLLSRLKKMKRQYKSKWQSQSKPNTNKRAVTRNYNNR